MMRLIAVLAGYWTGVLAVYMWMQARAHGPGPDGMLHPDVAAALGIETKEETND